MPRWSGSRKTWMAVVWLSYNWKWYFAVHEHSDVKPIQMRHHEPEDEPASRNREERTPISDMWWSASRWTDSWWEKSRWTWSQDFYRCIAPRWWLVPCVPNGVCTHLLPHAHFSATVCRTSHPDTLLTRVHTHARLMDVKKVCAVRKSWLSISLFALLMFHHSAPLLSENLFDTARQSLIFTELLPGSSRPRSAGPVHFRNSEDDFGYMANLPHSTGHEPQPAWQDGSCIWWPDAHQRSRPLTSEKQHTRTLDGSVFLQCVKVHTHPNTLKPGNRAEKQRRRSLETKTREWKLTSTSHWKRKAEWWQNQKWKSCWYREDLSCIIVWGKFTSTYRRSWTLRIHQSKSWARQRRTLLMWELFMSSSTKAAVHLGQKDVENNRMVMDVYVEEMKYVFSIVQKLVLENYDETLNVEVIDSDAP